MAGNSIRVLYVDHPDMAEIAETELGREDDIAVVTTSDPMSVPDQITDGDYDCLVSAYDLSGIDGLELYKQVQATVDHADIPYILFTDRGSEAVAADALNSGLDGYVRKEDDDAYTRLTDRIRDATEQAWFQTVRTELHATAQELMAATSETAVFDIGVETARDVLGYELAVMYRLDEEAGLIASVADTGVSTPDADGALDLCRRTLETTEPVVSTDPPITEWDAELAAMIAFPVGDRGVLLAGTTDPTVDPVSDRSLGSVLAGHLDAALQQVEREQDAVRQNERLDEFASVVSHELRNPLDFAVAHRELAVEKYGEDDHLDQIETAHTRMTDLIEDILLWAREGIGVSMNESVPIASVISESWEAIQSGSGTLTVDTDRTIIADRDRLKQLFDNLFENAIDHAGDSAHIRVGDLDDDGIFIADDGPGVPESEQESVFESGYTLSPNNTGIGLALVRQIVEAHGWEIELTDSSTGGARFEIRFGSDG